ncbi:MAG TPA: ABC transporter permease [Bryobacteraceae bacterium]|jgi:predicted permease|nr:ABC transporter permease [Bryobacteraceae bacterium]
MTWVRVLLSRIHSLFRKRQLDHQLDEELHFHLQRETDDLVAKGMTPEEAAIVARRKFGGLDQTKEIYRDARGVPLIEKLFQDVRYGLRGLRKNPSFTAVAVVSLALGIGANSAVFTILNASLLRDLPVRNPKQLVTVGIYRQGQQNRRDLSYPSFQTIAANQKSLSEMAASGSLRLKHVVFEGTELQELNALHGSWVSANYFSFLGLAPATGRFFTPVDSSRVGEGALAVIGYGLWENRLARDSAVLGKTLVLDQVPVTIVGVAPRDFPGDRQGAPPVDIWIPMLMQPRFDSRNLIEARGATWFRTLGRLKSDVTEPQANAELTALYRQDVAAAGAYRGSLSDLRVEVPSYSSGLYPQERRPMWQVLGLLMAVVGLVLLIACCNVANLLLARGSARRREIGVRLAIGCSRKRLIAQLLTESVLLSVLGGILGFLIAQAGTRLLTVGVLPASLDLQPNGRVLAFTIAVSLLVGVVFGLVPAIHATAVDIDPALRSSTRSQTASRSRQRTSRILVVAEIGLSLWLLVGAGLMLRTFQNFSAIELGVDRNVISLSVETEGTVNASQFAGLRNKLHDRLKTLPGVQSVSFSSQGVFSSSMTSAPVRVPGSSVDPANDPDIEESWVSAEFFQTMGLKLLLGRTLTEQDTHARVGVIDEVVARSYFGSENPLGKIIYFPKVDAQNRYVPFGQQLDEEQGFEIVGVVNDTKESVKVRPARVIYMPIEGRADFGNMLYIRTAGDPYRYKAGILQMLKEFDRDVAVIAWDSIEDRVERSVNQERFLATLLSTFGSLALILAAVGLFGVMAYAVVRRTGEIGIRMALGARRATVVAMVLRESLILTGAGVAIGIIAALASRKLLSGFLFGLTANDPTTIATASAILLGVAALAGYVPAYRASRVDPLIALRHE